MSGRNNGRDRRKQSSLRIGAEADVLEALRALAGSLAINEAVPEGQRIGNLGWAPPRVLAAHADVVAGLPAGRVLDNTNPAKTSPLVGLAAAKLRGRAVTAARFSERIGAVDREVVYLDRRHSRLNRLERSAAAATRRSISARLSCSSARARSACSASRSRSAFSARRFATSSCSRRGATTTSSALTMWDSLHASAHYISRVVSNMAKASIKRFMMIGSRGMIGLHPGAAEAHRTADRGC